MTEEMQSIEEQLDEQRNWSKLIPVALQKIYTFLSRSDREKMSLVCKDWYNGFHAPEIWKTFHFDFTCEQLEKNAKDIMEFVKDRRIYFKHVQITWNIGTNRDMILIWLKYFRDFYQLLPRAFKLESIKISFECYDILHTSDSIHESVCNEIAYFMKSKRNLKRLELYNCSFHYEEGIDLLKKLIEYNKDSLKHLVLRGFVTAVLPCKENRSTTNFSLPCLEVLEIDYLLIFGIRRSDLSDFAEKLIHCKKELIIKIFILFENPEGINNLKNLSSKDWSEIKEEYPKLEIEMKFGYLSRKMIDPVCFVEESMPITRLYYKFNHPSSSSGHGRDTSAYLTTSVLNRFLRKKINDRLVELSLIWQLPVDDLSDLFQFVSVCRKLKLLQVTKVHPVTHLRNFLKSLQYCRSPSLEKFVLNIAGTGNEDKLMFRNLADEFEPLLKSVNLIFDLHFI